MLKTLAVALALSAPVQVAAAEAESRTIAVTGRGEARAAPDMARAVLGVSLRRPAAGEASAAAAAAMSAVLAAVRAAGVAETDVRTIDLQLSPVWEWEEATQRNRQDGYEARHLVEAVVRDLDALGPLLDAAAQAGATEVGGVVFDLADRAAIEDLARRAAVADARRIAALLAEAAGESLGEPLSIAAGGPAWPGPIALRAGAPMADAAAAPPPVQPGELTIEATVSVVWALE
jgi:uncharacterized protein YggE